MKGTLWLTRLLHNQARATNDVLHELVAGGGSVCREPDSGSLKLIPWPGVVGTHGATLYLGEVFAQPAASAGDEGDCREGKELLSHGLYNGQTASLKSRSFSHAP